VSDSFDRKTQHGQTRRNEDGRGGVHFCFGGVSSCFVEQRRGKNAIPGPLGVRLAAEYTAITRMREVRVDQGFAETRVRREIVRERTGSEEAGHAGSSGGEGVTCTTMRSLEGLRKSVPILEEMERERERETRGGEERTGKTSGAYA
jgi:hypothetical protein